jgi:arginase
VKHRPLIGVPLDLGGARRGVDMGPSAFRIAGLGDQISSSATRSSTGRPAVADPETQTAVDPTKKYINEIAQVCRRLYE